MALTFDDGPVDGSTARVLEMLAEHDARATFFVVGNLVRANPELARTAAARGHEIGNHSYLHRPVRSATEVRECETVLAALGIRTRYFRPPGGIVRLSAFLRLWLAGYTTVFWSFDARDSLRFEGKSADRMPDYERVKQGDIVLMHDDNERCVEELPALLRVLRSKGLRPVTMSAFLASGTRGGS